MATHSSILAWRIPLDEGAWRATVLGGGGGRGARRVRHNGAPNTSAFFFLGGALPEVASGWGWSPERTNIGSGGGNFQPYHHSHPLGRGRRGRLSYELATEVL